MGISADSRKIIAEEFKYVAKKIREEKDIEHKLYFFSGTYAILYRTFNLEFDTSLLLAHSVLNRAYMEIDKALTRIIKGEEKVVKLPEELLSSLANAVDDLGEAILYERDISDSLQKIANITYVTTGNGYYLYQKGILKI